MPRFGSVCDDKVWRVPKLTSVSIVCRSCAWLTGAMMARSRASGDGGGAAPTAARLHKATNLRISNSPSSVAANPRAVECAWHCTALGLG